MPKKKESEETKISCQLSWPTLRLLASQPLPGDLFLCLRHKLVKYKSQGDELSPAEFDKLLFNQVRTVFIPEERKLEFLLWAENNDIKDLKKQTPEEILAGVKKVSRPAEVPEAEAPIRGAVLDLRKSVFSLFEAHAKQEAIKFSLQRSRELVTAFLDKPFVINNVASLHKFGKGAIDHAVNVSVTSIFVGLRLGYTSQVILEHLAIGGLLHDIGKTALSVKAEGLIQEDDPEWLEHPNIGRDLLEGMNRNAREIPSEVLMIVAQHHEFLDGTGFPKGMKGLAIYDLARIVAITNIFDNLMSKSAHKDPQQKALEALKELENQYRDKARLDDRKLEKVIKALRISLS